MLDAAERELLAAGVTGAPRCAARRAFKRVIVVASGAIRRNAGEHDCAPFAAAA